MKRKHAIHPVFQVRTVSSILTFILLIVTVSAGAVSSAACNIRLNRSGSAEEFSDKNARMYQMYFDSSPDPASNELQTRRFMGHLHLADIENIFGDIRSLPLDENCNFVGGPVLNQGLIWYITATPDLVGVNLISVAPDGTRSSAFDLDGDRIVDILDIRLSDLRRVSFVTEELGLDVFRYFLQGRNPLCDNELIRQLQLPELGCGETGDGSSGGGGGFAPGTNIIDPIDAICSEYDTSQQAGLISGATRGGPYISPTGPRRIDILRPHVDINTIPDPMHDDVRIATDYRVTETYVERDVATNEVVTVSKIITYYELDNSTSPATLRAFQVVHERVGRNGDGTRTIIKYNPDGTVHSTTTEEFTADEHDVREGDYDHNGSDPPSPPHPDNTSNGGIEGNPGPEGDDSAIAEFCRRRANHQSGIQQALEDDPTSIGVSCADLVDAPRNPNCILIEWAQRQDFRSILAPPSSDDGCDAFNDTERGCEPSVREEIRRFRGMTAELWSLDLPAIDICPVVVCDPGAAVEFQTYTAGEIEFSCAEIPETPTLEPSEENCPAGTYYAPVTNRCIAIQIVTAAPGGGDAGGNACQPPPGGCGPTEYWSTATCSCKTFE